MKFWYIATRLYGIIYQKTVFIITTMISQNTLMKWIIECSQRTATSTASLVQIFWSLHDIPADSVINPPAPELKPSNFRQNFITVDNSKQFCGMVWVKGSRNCYLIKTETRLKMYAFFWVIPRRLNFICWRFGTLCLFPLQRRVGVEWLVWEKFGYLYGKRFGSKIAWANGKEGDWVGVGPGTEQVVEGNTRGLRVGRCPPQPALKPDSPLHCHPPSHWLRLFSSQTFSRINTPTFLKPSHFFIPTCLWRWNRQCCEMSAYKIQKMNNGDFLSRVKSVGARSWENLLVGC